jgi:cell division protease FtsH
MLYQKAKKVLEDNIDILHKLSEILLEKETVMGAELDELILSMRPGIELTSNKIDDSDSKTDEVQKEDVKTSPSSTSSPKDNNSN